jgi:hypothetical protein
VIGQIATLESDAREKMDEAVVGANNARNDADWASGNVNRMKTLLENVKVFVELSKSVSEVRLYFSFDELYQYLMLTYF